MTDVDFVKNNRKIYTKIKNFVKSESDLNEKILLIDRLAAFAASHYNGSFSDNYLENELLKIANESIHLKSNTPPQKNTMLHVMSECYSVGGHTRVVNEWISNMNSFVHYCVLLSQCAEIPAWLKESCGDRLIVMDRKLSYLEKAQLLCDIAINKEFIILHTNMNDPIPILAFGQKTFPRPVIFYNHADHLFWLGVSISDLVIDLRSAGQDISLFARGAGKSEIGLVPTSAKRVHLREEAKQLLGVSLKSKLVVSSGSAYKYVTDAGFLGDVALNMVNQTDCNFVFIGPSSNEDSKWKQVCDSSNNRIKAIGNVSDPYEFDLYLDACDVYIDSYPFGSGTAVLQSAMRGDTPTLTCSNSWDVVKASYAMCNDIPTLEKKLLKILQFEYDRDQVRQLSCSVEEQHYVKNWIKKLEGIINIVKQKHNINSSFNSGSINNEITERLIILQTKQQESTNFGFQLRKFKLKNRLKLFFVVFDIKTFIKDVPRLYRCIRKR